MQALDYNRWFQVLCLLLVTTLVRGEDGHICSHRDWGDTNGIKEHVYYKMKESANESTLLFHESTECHVVGRVVEACSKYQPYILSTPGVALPRDVSVVRGPEKGITDITVKLITYCNDINLAPLNVESTTNIEDNPRFVGPLPDILIASSKVDPKPIS